LTRIPVLWLGIDNVSFHEAAEAVLEMCRSGRAAYVVTPNLDHFMRTRRDQVLRTVYEKADLSVADGVPVLWASRILGRPLKGRVNGTDLFEGLCAAAAREGLRVFLLGGAPGVAESAKEVLQKRYAGLSIVGASSPVIDASGKGPDDELTIRQIRAVQPHLLFTAFGCPKQELWMARNSKLLGPMVCIGVGGSFDLVAGYLRRAPRWMQRFGLEWLWRLVQEPHRLWKRYLVEDVPFFWCLGLEVIRSLAAPSQGAR